MALSKKRKVFVEEYLKCWNATQSAIKAGYSKGSAAVTGHRLLIDDNISDEISRRVDEIVMSANEALALLSDQARSSVGDYMDIDEEGRARLNFCKMKEKGKLHLIKSITPTANGIKVELHSSQRALELIGKAHGIFMDKVEHSGEINLTPDEWREQRERRIERVNDMMEKRGK
jgi:phage terminase small subunit